MEKICQNCKYWDGNDYNLNYEELMFNYDPIANEVLSEEFLICRSPKLKFYERSSEDGIIVVDGSKQKEGHLLTGKKFGCINWEACK